MQNKLGFTLPNPDEARRKKLAEHDRFLELGAERDKVLTDQAYNELRYAGIVKQLEKERLDAKEKALADQKTALETRQKGYTTRTDEQREAMEAAQKTLGDLDVEAVETQRDIGERAGKLFDEEAIEIRGQRGRAWGLALMQSGGLSPETIAQRGIAGFLAAATEIAGNTAKKVEKPLGQLRKQERDLIRERFNNESKNTKEIERLLRATEQNKLNNLEQMGSFETQVDEANLRMTDALNDLLDQENKLPVERARNTATYYTAVANKAKTDHGILKGIALAEQAKATAGDAAWIEAADLQLEYWKELEDETKTVNAAMINTIRGSMKDQLAHIGYMWKEDSEGNLKLYDRGMKEISPLVSTALIRAHSKTLSDVLSGTVDVGNALLNYTASLEEIFELPDTGESVTSVEALQSNIDIAKDQYKLDLNQVIKVWEGLSPSARKTNKKIWIKNYPNIQWDEVLQ
tara:strand:- start:1811 stop:3196 length:1386 start_codon:yes stop_codon:yes gene_type:complete